MLQQTQVVKVIPYYKRFLEKFPTVETLADASPTEVLDVWAGLGYYYRAKNLQAAAKTIRDRHGSRIPDRVEKLMELPGIGRYTAGAIASIAYDHPSPILDGNVIRVFCRYFGIEEDPKKPEVQKRLWKIASDFVPAVSPGDFNQALMELGALVCTPRRPQCGSCPLSGACAARKAGKQSDIPLRAAAARRKRILYVCGILEDNGRVLLGRRPLNGLLPGLWEFPGGEKSPGETAKASLARHLRERLGLNASPQRRISAVRQVLSHRQLEISAFTCRWSGKGHPNGYLESRWVASPELIHAPLTAGMLKLAKQLYG